MRTHIKAFIYKDKIPDVLSGKCTQTIRPRGKHPVEVGDYILFHGWESKPYKSKWSWRMKKVRVFSIIDCSISREGIASWLGDAFYPWSDTVVTRMAKLDYINPPTGEALGKLLNSMYDLRKSRPFQIIRWI